MGGLPSVHADMVAPGCMILDYTPSMASLGVLKFRPTFLKKRCPLLPGAFLSLLLKHPVTPSCFWKAFSVCKKGGGRRGRSGLEVRSVPLEEHKFGSGVAATVPAQPSCSPGAR